MKLRDGFAPLRTARVPKRPRRRTLSAAFALVVSALGAAPAMAARTASTHGQLVSAHLSMGPPCRAASGPTDASTGAVRCSTAAIQKQVDVLTTTLRYWRANYATTRSLRRHPGPVDVFDYDIAPLWTEGIDGNGTTVALVEGWNDPTIATSMAAFDSAMHLPPAAVTTIYPNGPLPPTCPAGMVALGSYGSCRAWEGELLLDVAAVHVIAPYARIVISATPADSQVADDAAAQVAPPELMKAVEVISAEHLANVISISDGTSETTYAYGPSTLAAQDAAELTAAARGVPLLVATGDCGVVQNLAQASSQCGATSTTPKTGAWDDSPWVTAVGGSIPNVAPTGTKAGADPLWPYSAAGYSSIYTRPRYQETVDTAAAMRSVPDITMDSSDGTSEAAPTFAGVLALATELAGGKDIGPINTALYRIGPKGRAAGIEDVRSGTDSLKLHTGTVVPGFRAGPGFDVASGWGTVSAPRFVRVLDRATAHTRDERADRRRASSELRSMERLQLTVTRDGSRVYVFGDRFLPRHPVVLSVDGKAIATLSADSLGDVTSMLDPTSMGLQPGTHTVSLASLLLVEKGTFTNG